MSKWENAIAEFFGISCDVLLTDEGRTEYEEIESIIQETEDSENALELLQNALKRFPKSYNLCWRFQMPEIYQTYPELMFYSLPGDKIYKGMKAYLAELRATADSIENVLKQSQHKIIGLS